MILAIGLMATWLGVNSVWGLTGQDSTLVSRWQASTAPLTVWLLGAVVLVAALVAVSRLAGSPELAAAASMLLAYLLGVAVSRWLHGLVDPPFGAPLRDALDPLRWAFQRSFLLLPAVPMLLVSQFYTTCEYPLRRGEWERDASPRRALGEDPVPAPRWRRRLLVWMLAVALPLTIFYQAGVGFAPLLSGRLIPFVVPLVLLALLNGFTEELLFRGLLMPPMVDAVGIRPGVGLQAVLFGALHWGASPDAVAGLPMAIVLAGIGFWFGNITLRTRGLAWVVLAHASLDFALFAAQFVAVD